MIVYISTWPKNSGSHIFRKQKTTHLISQAINLHLPSEETSSYANELVTLAYH